MRELWHFTRYFWRYLYFVRAVVVALVALVFGSAIVFMLAERLPFGESLYATAITALTIGYGDITPKTTAGRTVSIIIGIIGILFTGVIVAVATRALEHAAEEERERRETSWEKRSGGKGAGRG